MLHILEGQVFIALTTFFSDLKESQVRSNLTVASRHGGISSWPEAIRYLLRAYATASDMREVFKYLVNVKHKVDEKEDAYRKLLDEAIFRCPNVHS